MALSRLDNLYRQIILDHSTHPHHHGVLDEKTNQIEMNNPTCGDVIQLQLQVEDDTIKDIRFAGSGCSISQASASMMTDAVIGKKVADALEMVTQFSDLVQGKELPEGHLLGDAEVLSGVAKFPARIKCATLSWKAMQRALTEEQSTVIDGQTHGEE